MGVMLMRKNRRTDGYHNDYLIQIYDRQKKSCETLDLDYYFSAGLIGECLLVDMFQEDILCVLCRWLRKRVTWMVLYGRIIRNGTDETVEIA